MSIEDEYDLPRNRPFLKWLWILLVLALIAVGSYAYATNLGGVRDALASVRESAGAAVDEATQETEPGAGVDPATFPDPSVHDLSQRIADLELRSAVRDAVERHPELAGVQLQVEVVDGRVTLRGTANTTDQRDAVAEIAAREGAGSVANEVEVRATETETEIEGMDDPAAQLARKVEFELYSTDAFDLRHIEVGAAGGEVRLGGAVRSLAESLLAERIARDVAGVDTVINDLEVAGSEPL